MNFDTITDWNQTNEAIAKQFGCCDRTVRNARRARGLPRAPITSASSPAHPLASLSAMPCSAFACVNGTVDSYGRIEATFHRELTAHTEEQCRGRRWRWLVWEGRFHQGCSALNPDEELAIMHWIESHWPNAEHSNSHPDKI